MNTLERASRSARQMYPEADSIVVKTFGGSAIALVRVQGQVRMLRYSNLDAVYRVSETLSPNR